MAKISNVFAKEEVKKTTHPKRITKWIHYTKLAKNENNIAMRKIRRKSKGLPISLKQMAWFCRTC